MSGEVVHFRAEAKCDECQHTGCYEFPDGVALCPRHASKSKRLEAGTGMFVRGPGLNTAGRPPEHEPLHVELDYELTQEKADEQMESINERARELDEEEIDIGLLPEEQRDNQLVSLMADVGLAYAIRAGVFPEDELEATRQAATRFRSKAFESEVGPAPPTTLWSPSVDILVALAMVLGAILVAVWMLTT